MVNCLTQLHCDDSGSEFTGTKLLVPRIESGGVIRFLGIKLSGTLSDLLLGQDGYVKMSILWHKNYCQLITQDHAVTLHSDINGPVVVILQLVENNSFPLHQLCSDC